MKKYMRKFLITGLWTLTGFSFSATVGAAEHPWQLRVKKETISVYTRKVDASAILEFKSDATVSAPIDRVIALFEDEKKMSQWYYQCTRMELVQDKGPLEKVFYFVLHLPGPVAERDAVFRRLKSVDPLTGTVTYELTALPEEFPRQKGKIRVPYLKTLWRFTPLKEEQTEIYFQQHSDAGGSLPAFLANALVVDIPLKSLKKFKKLVEEQKIN